MSLLSDLLPRLSHSNPGIRKKTVVALYRLALVYPEALRPAWPQIKDLLMNEEEDTSVTAAVVNVVLKYVALLAFKQIVVSHPDLVSSHQDVIMGCIDDQDVSIRLQALDLSAGMVGKDNLVNLVSRLLRQLYHTPEATGGAKGDRRRVPTVEPAIGSDGQDPEQALVLSRGNSEDDSAISSGYRIAIIKQIVDMCAKDTYANITDFEWYIKVLVQLVRLVPPASMTNSENLERPTEYNSTSLGTRDDTASYIGRELLNVAVRVSSVRSEAVQAAASLLSIAENHASNLVDVARGAGALHSAAWIVGEFADYLTDVSATLTTITNTLAADLQPTVLCAYLQTIPKLFIAIVLRQSRSWNAERQTTVPLLMSKILYHVEPLTAHPSLEVQERAVEFAELIKVSSEAVTNHIGHSDQGPLFLTKVMPQLFGESELNPVAPSAQRRIPAPQDLDLDRPLNRGLANLLGGAMEDRDWDSNSDMVDFQIFYTQLLPQNIKEALPATQRPPRNKHEDAAYQSIDEVHVDANMLTAKRFERHSRNRDDPFYIASEDTSSGTSTPFHNIIKSTNGEGVDVDSIPILSLDLGEDVISNSQSDTTQSTRKTKFVKKYRVASDENIDTGYLPEAQPTSRIQREYLLGTKGGAGNPLKQSLLEVNSSGLDGMALEGGLDPSMGTDADTQAFEEAEMAKALREVERLRLEMQRASERVRVSEGMPVDGTMVKKKKRVKNNDTGKSKADAAAMSGEESLSISELAARRAHPVSLPAPEGESAVVKRKKKRKTVRIA
ncbi:MAG: hypothetical protein Q9174_001587 [Haloplaca sp. 1 TL-2023]